MIQPVTDLPLLTWAQFKQQLTEAGIPLELAQKTIQEGLEKFAKMKADPASVVSSAEMRKRMAERGVYVEKCKSS
jgi:hypothetical protein